MPYPPPDRHVGVTPLEPSGRDSGATAAAGSLPRPGNPMRPAGATGRDHAADHAHVPAIGNPRAVDGSGTGALAENNAVLDLADIRNSLRALMWRHVGVEREGGSLAEALETVEGWCRYVLPRQFSEPQGWHLQNMLKVARLMIRGAIERRETRGVHFRNDFPDTIADWRAHLGWQRGRPQPLVSPPEAAAGAAGAC